MKLIFKLLLVSLIIATTSESSYGQRFLDKVKEKAKEKIEQKIDKKAQEKQDEESETENRDGTENSSEDSNAGSALQNRLGKMMMKGMGMSGEAVQHESHYAFNQLVQMHLESYDSEEHKTSNGEFITHLNTQTGDLAYEVISNNAGDDNQGVIIIDAKNKAVVMLNDKENEKTGTVYGMGSIFENMDTNESPGTEPDDKNEETSAALANMKPTGKTKKIAGYTCKQYLYNTTKVDSEFWITDELQQSERDFFSGLFQTDALTHGMGYGFVMESVSRDKESGNTSKMTVTKVDKKSSRKYDLSSYKITNLGSFQMPAGNK